MGFQDVAFLPSTASFPPQFLKIVIEFKASRPNVVKLLLEQSKGNIPVKYFHLIISLCQFNFLKIIRLSQH